MFPAVAVVALISNSSGYWDLIIFVISMSQKNGSEVVKEMVLSAVFVILSSSSNSIWS